MTRILIVDDEAALTQVLQPVLVAAGYEADVAISGGEALRRIDAARPELLLLDLGLPDLDGKQVIAQVRARHDVPIIVISARHLQAEKIAALDEGADDYVDKPFEIGELLARIRVALRRRGAAGRPGLYRSGPLAIDIEARQVTVGGKPVRFSPKEYDLLVALAENAGRVVTHKRLLEAGWGGGVADTQYLRVYIGVIRQKIEQDPADPHLLLTEPGVGYRLAAAEP